MIDFNAITAFGKTLPIEEWIVKSFVKASPREIVRRLEMGVPAQQALSDPPEDGPRKSRYRGVTWHVNNKKWHAQIKVNGKVEFLGVFDCDKEAAQVYNARAEQLGRQTNAL